MPNIASAFRQEVTRLARREIRNAAQPLRKASAQFRREIAELKRQAAKLKSDLAGLQRRAGNGIAPAFAEAEPARARFSAKSVISQRKRLGLSAADFGKLIGVTGKAIYTWEHGNSRPRNAQLIALASIRSMGRRAAVARLDQLRGKSPTKRAAGR